MSRTVDLAIRITADSSRAVAGLNDAGNATSQFENNARRAGVAAVGVLGALGVIGKEAFDAASKLQQASGAVESVFGTASSKVNELAANAAQSVGLATSQYSNLAALLGSQLKNLGVSQDQIVGKTDDLIKQGADLAATFGGTTADAVAALSSLMKGETDPIEKYGVSIKQSDVNARLAAQGQDKLTGAAKVQAETQARLALLTEQTTAAQGAFGREANTAAGQQERLAAQFENAKAALGTALLPIVSKVAQAFAGMAKFAQDNVGAVQAVAAVLGVLAAAVLAVNVAMKVWRAAVVVATAVQWLWNIALTANPIGAIIVAIVAVVAALVYFFTKTELGKKIWKEFTRIALEAWAWIKTAVSDFVAWIVGVWNSIVAGATAAWNWVSNAAQTAWAAVQAIVSAVASFIGSIISGAVAIVTGAWNLAASVASAVWNGISAVVSAVGSVIGSVISAAVDIVVGVFNTARSVGTAAFDAVAAVVNTVAGAIQTVIGWIQKLINWISNIKWPSPPSWVSGLFGGPGPEFAGIAPGAQTFMANPFETFAAPGPDLTAAASPLEMLGRVAAAGNGGPPQITNVTVNVTGAVDPMSAALQIERILTGRDRTVGNIAAVALSNR